MADSSSSTDPDVSAAFGGLAHPAPLSTAVTSTDPDVNAVTFQDEQKKLDASKGPSWKDRALGAGDIAATAVLNIPHAIMGSAHDIYSRITTGEPNHSAPLEAKLGPSGTALVNEVKNSAFGGGVSGALESTDETLGKVSPTLQDVAHNTLDVGGDALNLAPLGAGALGAVKGVAGLAESAAGAGLSATGREGAVSLLKSEGIPLSVAQESGSKLAQHVERASAMTGDRAAEFSQQQAEALNKAVLKRAGVTDANATAATPDVMSAAKDRITGKMNDIAARNPIPLDDTLLSHLAEMQQEAPKMLPQDAANTLNHNIDDIVSHAAANDGKLDGTYYQKLNTRLGKLSSDPRLAPVMQELKEHVNDAMERSASAQDVQDLQQARQQYRVLKQIEPAIDPVTGNISANKLMNSINVKANRNQSLYGRGDQSLVSLARAAKMVLPDQLGNSGTAERLLPAQGAIETLGSGKPVEAASKLLAGTLGLNAAGRVMRGVPGTPSGAIRGFIPGVVKGLPGPALGPSGVPLSTDQK
jgi:hypothetical protein